MIAAGLRRAIPVTAGGQLSAWEWRQREMFADTLASAPRQWHGYLIALCIYATGYALLDRSNLTAGAVCATAAFLFAWNWNLAPDDRRRSSDKRRAALRLVRVTLPAILATAWALMMGAEHRDAAAEAAALAGGGGGDAAKRVVNLPTGGLGADGYESIVLWQYPEKNRIIAPVPVRNTLWAPGDHKPLVIRFDGEYWYFQPPGLGPGRRAHQAHGTPVDVHIQSTNDLPLTMEAHQRLGSAIRLSRCADIEVGLENRDNVPGTIAMALLLRDSSQPGRASVYLGSQTLETSVPPRFAIKTASVAETLRFPVPAEGSIRKFDEITVLLLPDIEHKRVGPKIAIRQFELIPR